VHLLIRADFLDLSESTVATGYCMKCKAQREIQNAKQITMKNGRPATEGACPVCGTKIFKIGAGK
jgi:DNA-directed RNA polymerase subunit RPC12/RpoP